MNAELATPSPATFGTASGPLVDTVRLANGHWVAASDTQVWLHREIIPGQIPLSEHISEPGDAERMRQLMAGILVAGLRQSTATRAPYAVSWQRHVWSLASSYQTTHATPSVMRRVADRFDAENRPELADWCRHVADEESGHDELALRDLATLGLNGEAFVAEVRPAHSLQLVNCFQKLADGPQPVAVLGYAYVLERTALFATRERVEAVEASLPPGVRATRCLRVHSAAGTDVRHVQESLSFIATLPASDRKAICQGAFETAALMRIESDYPGDEAIEALVTQFRAATA